MTAVTERGRTRGEPQPIPIEEERVRRMLYKRIWDAKFESKKEGWIRLFRVNNETGEGYIYPDENNEVDHPGYSFDKDKLGQIWKELSSTFKLASRDGYFFGYDEELEQSAQTRHFSDISSSK